MTPKLLLALALVGAMYAGEPFKLGPTMTNSGPIVLSHTTKDGNIDVDTTMTFPDVFVGKIVVRREPTVTRKADGSWEITFAGKTEAIATAPVQPGRIEAPLKPSEMVEVRAVTKERDELKAKLEAAIIMPPYPSAMPPLDVEAASKIVPPVVLTVLWPNDKIDADKHAWLVSEAAKDENKGSLVIHSPYYGDEPFFIKHDGKRYEFGLRSDGCVVWRERK